MPLFSVCVQITAFFHPLETNFMEPKIFVDSLRHDTMRAVKLPPYERDSHVCLLTFPHL